MGRFYSVLIASICLVLSHSTVLAENGGRPGFSGSDSCRDCHKKIYQQWKLTPHANMLLDAKKNPSAIKAKDFGDEIPFRREDIVFTVGSHWTQKYLTRIDGKLYVLPKFWNIAKGEWDRYSIFNWREKPYNVTCDGCHTVGFDGATESFFEPGIGCESCHGPGKAHVESEGDVSKIVNPLKLDEDRALMVCMQCHTDGTDTAFNKYPFAVNYLPGEDLNEYLSDFFMPKPKSNRWYWGSMDFMERRRMYYFFASKFYSTARACDVCGFDRQVATKESERYMDKAESCGSCHSEIYKRHEPDAFHSPEHPQCNDCHAPRMIFKEYQKHSGHTPDEAQCTDCHTPEIVEKTQSYSIHDHKFDFSQPKLDCSACHDKMDSGDRAVISISADGAATWKEEPKDHGFHIAPVSPPMEMTIKEACLYCHKERDAAWVDSLVPSKIGFRPPK